jgi:hypothetical protein
MVRVLQVDLEGVELWPSYQINQGRFAKNGIFSDKKITQVYHWP